MVHAQITFFPILNKDPKILRAGHATTAEYLLAFIYCIATKTNVDWPALSISDRPTDGTNKQRPTLSSSPLDRHFIAGWIIITEKFKTQSEGLNYDSVAKIYN